MSIYCSLCDYKAKSLKSLSVHLNSSFKENHKCGSKQYYDQFLKTSSDGCVECGKETRFLNLVQGYVQTCGNHCAGIRKRRLLKEDPEKFKKFVDKVTKNVTNTWSKRTDDEKIAIFLKISNKNKEINSTLNKEELRKKYSRYFKCDEKTIDRLNLAGRKQCLKNLKNGLLGVNSTMKGRFQPSHPEKYVGDAKNIIYRSSWELKFCSWCDKNDSIIDWQSEEFFIYYRDPITNKIRRYFPDFLITAKTKEGKIVKKLIEIKPKIQTIAPPKRKKISKSYINEIATFGTNQAKWAAARIFCKARNWEFNILTENELYPNGIPGGSYKKIKSIPK